MYGMTGAARLISGVLLTGAALYLWRAWAAPFGRAQLAAILLAASGVITAVSGAGALVLTAVAEASASRRRHGRDGRDGRVREAANRQPWLCHGGHRHGGRGSPTAAARRPPSPVSTGVAGDRYRHAVHLAGRGDTGSPGRRRRVLRLAPCLRHSPSEKGRGPRRRSLALGQRFVGMQTTAIRQCPRAPATARIRLPAKRLGPQRPQAVCLGS